MLHCLMTINALRPKPGTGGFGWEKPDLRKASWSWLPHL